MTTTFNPAKYPSVITSDALLKRLKPGEGRVTVMMRGAGSPTAFQFHGRGAKVYVFAWSRRLLAHVLRAPVDLWNGGLAQDLLDQSKLTYPLVPLFEKAAEPVVSVAEAAVATAATAASTPSRLAPAPRECVEKEGQEEQQGDEEGEGGEDVTGRQEPTERLSSSSREEVTTLTRERIVEASDNVNTYTKTRAKTRAAPGKRAPEKATKKGSGSGAGSSSNSKRSS